MLFCLGMTLGLSLPITPLAAQSWTLQGAAINGAAAGDRSGYVSLSSDGTTMAIGVPRNDGGGNDAGQVRVYKLVSGTWQLQGAAINSAAASDNSGRSVSLSADGTTVAIGATGNDDGGSGSGHVRVYKLESGTWTLQGAAINGAAANDQSGSSVSLSADGTTVAIGAPQNAGGGSNRGHVRVYKLVSGTWELQGAAINGAANNNFSGSSVSLSSDGTTVAIGAPYNSDGGSFSGHVRVYKLVSGTWELQGAAINGAANDQSGISVSLSSDGTTVAIGAPFNSDGGSASGRVRVYKLVSGTWELQGAAINGAANDQSGISVSLSSDGTTVAIGAPFNSDGGSTSGRVRVYKLVSGTWTLQGAAINGAAADDQSGTSVSLSADGTTVAIGAPGNSDGGFYSGHVRVFYNASVLPIELVEFKGTPSVSGNLLTWITANEVNNKGFAVERRQATGDSWDNIGFKTANNKVSNYQFTDNTPLSISSYRLRQIDNDGTETLSKIITIQNKGTKGKLAVYPNPVANVLTVELDSPLWGLGAGNFQILNLLGQQVLTGKTAQRIDVSALPQGTYFLKVGAEQVKFVKQ